MGGKHGIFLFPTLVLRALPRMCLVSLAWAAPCSFSFLVLNPESWWAGRTWGNDEQLGFIMLYIIYMYNVNKVDWTSMNRTRILFIFKNAVQVIVSVVSWLDLASAQHKLRSCQGIWDRRGLCMTMNHPECEPIKNKDMTLITKRMMPTETNSGQKHVFHISCFWHYGNRKENDANKEINNRD